MRHQPGTDRLIARLASRRHGLVTRAQLLTAGVTLSEIRGRIARGSLIAVHRGVYRVGHVAPSLEARYLAAVLACGERAFLAGLAAGHLLELVDRGQPAPRVWAPTARTVPGVLVRRYRVPFGPGETARVVGIPATSVARTLLDLAAHLPFDELARAFHQARVLHRARERQILRVVERRPAAPGRARLRAVLLGDLPVTLSRLETAFLDLLRDEDLPLPDEVNRMASARCVDCRYDDPPLTVELDSYGFHATRHAWENDRRREREAYARGDQHRRYTYGDVFEDPRLMLSELRVLLDRRVGPR